MSSPPTQPAAAPGASTAASPAAATAGSSPPAAALEPDVDTAPAEDEDDDGSSAYGESLAGSDTASLASSILKYRMENGRRYHAYKAGAYILPNDDIENERLDLQHNLCVLTQGNKLFLAPVGKDKPLHRVLDAGTGTGIWAMDFADEHPEASVVGVDLSPIQPSFVPPNVEFFIDDLEAEWTFIRPFDFIYCRMLTGSIRDWPKLFGQAMQHLNPGGYIELHDPSSPLECDDGSLPKDCAVYKWNMLFLEASIKLGAPMNSSNYYEQQLKDAGFVNVTVVEEKWPINTWPKDKKYKEIGAWVQENIQQGLEALSLALFTNVLGWAAEEVQLLLVDVRKDLRRREYHAYWPVRTVYGQKPE